MGLDIAANFAYIIFKLVFYCIEGIAQGDINILRMVAVNHNLIARHADADANVVLLALSAISFSLQFRPEMLCQQRNCVTRLPQSVASFCSRQ